MSINFKSILFHKFSTNTPLIILLASLLIPICLIILVILGDEGMIFPHEPEGKFYQYPMLHYRNGGKYTLYASWALKEHCNRGAYEMREVDYKEDPDTKWWGGGPAECREEGELLVCKADIPWRIGEVKTYQLQLMNSECESRKSYVSPVVQFTTPLFTGSASK